MKYKFYNDFAPDGDEDDDIGEEIDVDARKFSIRALNFKMMSKLTQITMLARASSKLLPSNRGNGRQSNINRATLSARKTN